MDSTFKLLFPNEEPIKMSLSSAEILRKTVGKVHVLAFGKPETGKTHMAYEIAGKLGVQIVRGNCTPDTSGAEWRGFWAPAKDGFTWQEGLAVKAIKSGGILLIDDIHLAGPDLLAVLYPMLDRHPIDLPNGEQVDTARACVYATSNEVPDNLPDGLASRFELKVEVTELSEEAILSVGEKFSPILRRGVWGIRTVKAFKSLLDNGVSEEEAGEIVFGPAFEGIKDSLAVANSSHQINEL